MMNTAKIGKMQSSMSNQKTTATLPTKQHCGADYSDFESMFWSAPQEVVSAI
jgi:hypothetical protein